MFLVGNRIDCLQILDYMAFIYTLGDINDIESTFAIIPDRYSDNKDLVLLADLEFKRVTRSALKGL